MKKGIFVLLALFVLGCGQKPQKEEIVTEQNSYQQISAEEAKRMMDELEDEIVLDVREQNEYDAGHVPAAVLLPVGDIEEMAAAVIPTKDTVVLVYCRSGNRSKMASEALVKLGYTQVYEFGGIRSWPYEVEK